MAEEWFRSPDWSEAARSDFETRLARARPTSRAQYLRIKAIALIEAGVQEDADELLRRLVTDYPESLDARFANELRGDIAVQADRLTDAVELYRTAIDHRPDLPALSGTSGQLHTKLADVLFALDPLANNQEIDQNLQLGAGHLTFNADVFRWCVLMTRVAQVRGDVATAKSSAERAVSAAEAGSQFQRHPGVGLVETEEETMAWLRATAST